jgi:hypothetical protein
METILLTIYVLMWPVIVGGTLFMICKGFFRDWAESRREGRSIIYLPTPNRGGSPVEHNCHPAFVVRAVCRPSVQVLWCR